MTDLELTYYRLAIAYHGLYLYFAVRYADFAYVVLRQVTAPYLGYFMRNAVPITSQFRQHISDDKLTHCD